MSSELGNRLYPSSSAAFSLSSSSIRDPFPSPNLSRLCSLFAPSPFRNQLTHHLLGSASSASWKCLSIHASTMSLLSSHVSKVYKGNITTGGIKGTHTLGNILAFNPFSLLLSFFLVFNFLSLLSAISFFCLAFCNNSHFINLLLLISNSHRTHPHNLCQMHRSFHCPCSSVFKLRSASDRRSWHLECHMIMANQFSIARAEGQQQTWCYELGCGGAQGQMNRPSGDRSRMVVVSLVFDVLAISRLGFFVVGLAKMLVFRSLGSRDLVAVRHDVI
ncbi:hypothetical protein KCU71_g122, partial [Aureobasidium melanogenum]